MYALVFITQIGKYKHVPRHPLFWALATFFDRTGKFENVFVNGLKKADGSFKPVTNIGPWGDGNPYLIVSDADAFRDILKNTQRFPKLPASYRWFSTLIGRGLVTAEGIYHKEERRRITPLFHFKILKQIVPRMVEYTQILVDNLKGSDKFHPAKPLFSLHTMRVIVSLAFGGDFEAEWMSETWYKITRAFSNWTVGSVLFGSIWNHIPIAAGAGFFKAKQALKDEICKVIAKRKKQYAEEGDPDPSKRNDLLYHLLRAKDLKGNPVTLNEEDIVNEALTFLFAGHDTSSASLSWIFYYLARYTRIFKRVREEVDREIGMEEVNSDNIRKLKFTKNVIKESLRMSPVIPMVDRTNAEDCEIDGVLIPKGSYLGIFLWSVMHDTRYWDEPYTFDPDRFSRPQKKKHDFSNIPFSAGERNCIGSKFAEQEILIAVAMIVRELDVTYDQTKNIVATFEGVVEPTGLELKFSKRNFDLDPINREAGSSAETKTIESEDSDE